MAKKKTEKPEIVLPDKFNLVAADLSLNRPGFCLWTQTSPTEIEIKTMNVNNKKIEKRGEKLDRIFAFCGNFRFDNDYPTFFIREHAFNSRASQYEIGIFEVVGITDWWLWCHNGNDWEEMYPVTIKKIITGNPKADKKTVEKCLADYVGKREYACDDESDATALAVAFLITKGKMTEIKR